MHRALAAATILLTAARTFWGSRSLSSFQELDLTVRAGAPRPNSRPYGARFAFRLITAKTGRAAK
jgi:hypothetical protein